MAKMSTSGRLRLKRLKRINKTLSLSLKNKKEQDDLDDYIRYKAEECRYEYLLNQLDD